VAAGNVWLVSEHRTSRAPRKGDLDPGKLRIARRAAGLSQDDLATLADTSRGQVAHHEAGDWQPLPALLRLYAEACNVEPRDLMRDDIAA